MLAVGTPFMIVTAWPWDERTPVTYACSAEVETACSCPEPLSCASTHCTGVSAFVPRAYVPRKAAFSAAAPRTIVDGAIAKTKTLPVAPTSCDRYWICADAFDVVAP